MAKLKEDFKNFINEAKKICKDRVYDNYLLRYAYGTDASCYSYTPEVAIKANSELEILDLLRIANYYETPVTFRAAGSSLSGQCSSDKVLIICNDGFKNISINDDASIIELDCGVIASDANRALKAYGKKIGPDPATIETALIGGILNNNSSGMCCGVAQNSYHTIHSIRVILLDGTILDTASSSSLESFLNTHKDMVQKLLDLRKTICEDDALHSLIMQKYKIKNTTGYSLNALVDFDEIKEIINHIFVGSEGTLGFVSKIRYYTVDDYPFKGCGLLFYDDLSQASEAVVKLANLDSQVISAAEMMDYSCIKAVKQSISDIPEQFHQCTDGYTVILIQSQSSDESLLNQNLKLIQKSLDGIKMALPPLYSTNEKEFNQWWKIRKSILPIVAGSRGKENTIITEDVCFTIDKFCDGVAMLRELFVKYHFEDGVIFGHALSGNLHFNITPNLSSPDEYTNFANLVDEMSENVAKMNGSIKAEHGTGRMVAPFIEVEWGKKAFLINQAIKEIFDSRYLINPDVIITKDSEVYKKNLKTMPKTLIPMLKTTADMLNTCMECGFCEKGCPSKNITLTPRQRISVLREISRLLESGETKKANEMLEDYNDYGVDTCAGCSECFELCPLKIDVAKIMKELRVYLNANKENLNNAIHKNFDKAVAIAKFGLSMYSLGSAILPAKTISNITKNLRKVSTKIPYAPPIMPRKNNFRFTNKEPKFQDKVLYFSACTNRMFAPNKSNEDTRSIQEVFESICKKAGISPIYPRQIAKMCCGKLFEDHQKITEKNRVFLEEQLLKDSENGEIPIVIDHSSCFYQMFKSIKNDRLKLLDISEFIFSIAHKLEFHKIQQRVLIHKLCLLKRIKKDHYIEKLAQLCFNDVSVIKSFECCGFAGDKGFFAPKLNQSSTKYLRDESKSYDIGVSTSGTCEIGLSSYSDINFQNIIYLVDRVSSNRL